MVGTTFLRVLLASSLVFLAAAATQGTAMAQIMEPPDTVNTNGFGPIPIDPRTLCNNSNSGSGLATGGSIGCTGTANINDFACCDDSLDNMSLIGLFKYYESDANGNVLVDYQKDAKTEPATFNPLCSINGKMVMHGGGCQVDFGWYCADGTPNPTIYPLVTSAQIQAYSADPGNLFPTSWKNNDGAFLPKTSYVLAGTPLTNVASDPNFLACSTKKIGFAVKGGTNPNGTGVCTQSKYTETKLNQISSASGQPYVTAVIYSSKNFPGRFYIAIEDLPTSAAQFNPPVPGKGWQADGDFNDFVYTVEGVVCQGGGQLCTVPGQQGICATGVTDCVNSGSNATPACNAVFTPQPEKCNAIDDDCNGLIDDGTGLCPGTQVCYKGTCVGSCATGEIVCPGGQACVGVGLCVDAACASVDCAPDQKCVNQNGTGVCVGGCTGVVCGPGQQCVAGTCVDLCSIRTTACPTNFVCQNGACVPDCNCLPCADGLSCASNGQCLPSGCENSNCTAPQICIPGGNCVDPCANNTCAAPTKCSPFTVYDKSKDPNGDGSNQYACTNPDGTVVGAGGSGTAGSGPCLGANCNVGGSGTAGGNGSAAGPSSPANSTSSLGCGCRVAGDGASRFGLAGLLGLTLLALRRRRRN
jgi:MYXO-CTERM domain-containing protein